MNNILCKKCNQVLTEENFYFRNGKILRPCKDCKKKYYVSWVERHPQYHQKWREEKKNGTTSTPTQEVEILSGD